jgi:hypothetical protein
MYAVADGNALSGLRDGVHVHAGFQMGLHRVSGDEVGSVGVRELKA